MLRIGIAGIFGRMGQLLAKEVVAAGHSLVGGIDHAGSTHADIGALAGECDVVVDFTNASAAQAHATAVAAAGCAWVLGTSGLQLEDEAAVARAAEAVPVVYAANFSAGVVLLLDLAERLGASLPAETYDAEILEMHHRHKVDAPSGTALALGRAAAAGRGVALEDVRESGRDGQVGARRPGAIGFASLRGGEVAGEHTLFFTAAHEQIALTHRAFDRAAFAAGAVRAAGWVAGRPAGLYGMAHVLGLR